MPGPKFPNGYAKPYHDIMDKLLSERPAKLTVDMPTQAGYARTQFNYFRQSWLRYSEFLKKRKDEIGSREALDTYNRLASYMVQISPPFTLIFTSKEISQDLNMRTEGAITSALRDWLPRIEDKKAAGLSVDEKEILSDIWRSQQKGIEEAAIKALGLKPKASPNANSALNPNSAPIIPDNPPPTAPSANERSEAVPASNKYGLPIGPPPGFSDEK